MRRGKTLIYISILIVTVIVFLFYKYFFNIYETNVIVEPKKIFTDNRSEVSITLVPLNSFGSKALFRNIPATFELSGGETLVDIKTMDSKKGKLSLKAKQDIGKVVIIIRSSFSLFPIIVEIPIHRHHQ